MKTCSHCRGERSILILPSCEGLPGVWSVCDVCYGAGKIKKSSDQHNDIKKDEQRSDNWF